MARAQSTDFLHSMKFHVDVVSAGGENLLAVPGNPQAGFSNVTVPEVSVEAVEYKEGLDIYTRKYPGNPTVNEVTLSKGTAVSDSAFWHWLRTVVEGSGEYRADVDIQHFHRQDALTRLPTSLGSEENLTVINTDTPGRIYHLKEAFPMRHKIAGDLDATASEISIMELDLAIEHVEVEELGTAA